LSTTPAWLYVLQNLQRDSTEAHIRYLHLSQRAIEIMASGIGGHALRQDFTSTQAPSIGLNPLIEPEAPTPPLVVERKEAQPVEPTVKAKMDASVEKAKESPTATPMVEENQKPVATALAPEQFLQALLDVVADKTGYPLDLLEPQMDIETDLGIDSIKRVEILSALQERFPNLPEVDLSEVASLRTIAEIAAYIEKNASSISNA
jgi:acyl carrier protein